MTHRIRFALALSLVCAGTASAEIHRTSLSLNDYVHLVAPGAESAKIQVPVIASFSNKGELGHLLSGNAPDAPSGDEVIALLDATWEAPSEQSDFAGSRYAAVLREALRLADANLIEGHHTVLLVRLATATDRGPRIQTLRDEAWEVALERWHDLAANRDLAILSLSTE